MIRKTRVFLVLGVMIGVAAAACSNSCTGLSYIELPPGSVNGANTDAVWNTASSNPEFLNANYAICNVPSGSTIYISIDMIPGQVGSLRMYFGTSTCPSTRTGTHDIQLSVGDVPQLVTRPVAPSVWGDNGSELQDVYFATIGNDGYGVAGPNTWTQTITRMALDRVSCDQDHCGEHCSSTTDGCNDSNSCTTDVCDGATCVFTPYTCVDFNGCTADLCDGEGGCSFPAYSDGTGCASDANPCTDDVCIDGTCEHEPKADGASCSDDGDDCTDDICVSGTCQHPTKSNGAACTADADICTDDVCQSGVCVHPDNTAPCDDGDECTVGDACSQGVCTAGLPKDCSDGDACTVDTCSGAGVCDHAAMAVGSECDDGNVCTQDTVCNDMGQCTGTLIINCDALGDAVPGDGKDDRRNATLAAVLGGSAGAVVLGFGAMIALRNARDASNDKNGDDGDGDGAGKDKKKMAKKARRSSKASTSATGTATTTTGRPPSGLSTLSSASKAGNGRRKSGGMTSAVSLRTDLTTKSPPGDARRLSARSRGSAGQRRLSSRSGGGGGSTGKRRLSSRSGGGRGSGGNRRLSSRSSGGGGSTGKRRLSSRSGGGNRRLSSRGGASGKRGLSPRGSAGKRRHSSQAAGGKRSKGKRGSSKPAGVDTILIADLMSERSGATATSIATEQAPFLPDLEEAP